MHAKNGIILGEYLSHEGINYKPDTTKFNEKVLTRWFNQTESNELLSMKHSADTDTPIIRNFF